MAEALELRPPIVVPEMCPRIFYGYGGGYPDAICHDGHLDDADSDSCYEDSDFQPCPACMNKEYLERLADGGRFCPPYGFYKVVAGDYFALPDGSTGPKENADG